LFLDFTTGTQRRKEKQNEIRNDLCTDDFNRDLALVFPVSLCSCGEWFEGAK